MRHEYEITYDPIKGEVQTFADGVMQDAIEVRQGLMDTAIRYAAIVELEKLGYTVIPPEEESP